MGLEIEIKSKHTETAKKKKNSLFPFYF